MKVDLTERFILLNDFDFREFKSIDFDKITNEKKKNVVVLHGENLQSSLVDLEKNFKEDYFIQLGFTASQNQIKTLGSNNNLLNKKTYETKSDAFDDIRSTYFLETEAPWFKYISESLHKENLYYLERELDLSRILVLKDSTAQIVAMIMNFDSTYFNNEPVDQIGWVWVKNDLRADLRKEAHEKISNWLKENQTRNFYQAGIHIENRRSQNFFKKIGFKASCAHITRR